MSSIAVAHRSTGRPALVLLVLGALATFGVQPVEAQQQRCQRVLENDQWVLRCNTSGGNSSGNGAETRPIRVEGFYSILLRWAPELGEDVRCWEVRFHPRPGTAPGEGTWTWQDAHDQGQESWGHHPECPRPEQAPSPVGAITSFWTEQQPVPDFDVDVAPGWALTGMPAYLEVDGMRELDQSFDLPAPFGFSASLTASATYDIDWGDGSPVQTGVTDPGPWPEGEARHTYTLATPVVVSVTAVWTGSWQAGGFGGDLPAIRRTTEHPLEVRQVQAVRTADR